MLALIELLGRFRLAARGREFLTKAKVWAACTIVAALFAVASGSARAEDPAAETPQTETHTFQSLLSTDTEKWCITVPGGAFQAGTELQVSACTGATEQVITDPGDGSLTAGGYCADAAGANGAVSLADCDASDRQNWGYKTFSNNADAYEILNSTNFCMTVDGTIGEGAKVTLAECQERPEQGWLLYTAPATTAEANPDQQPAPGTPAAETPQTEYRTFQSLLSTDTASGIL